MSNWKERLEKELYPHGREYFTFQGVMDELGDSISEYFERRVIQKRARRDYVAQVKECRVWAWDLANELGVCGYLEKLKREIWRGKGKIVHLSSTEEGILNDGSIAVKLSYMYPASSSFISHYSDSGGNTYGVHRGYGEAVTMVQINGWEGGDIRVLDGERTLTGVRSDHWLFGAKYYKKADLRSVIREGYPVRVVNSFHHGISHDELGEALYQTGRARAMENRLPWQLPRIN